MKKLLLLSLLLGSLQAGVANAAPVTFTFDDPSIETTSYIFDPSLGGNVPVVELGGFVVQGLSLVDIDSDGDIELFTQTLMGIGNDYAYPIRLYRSDGQAFALHSVDLLGAIVAAADPSTGSDPIGSSAWLNVTEVTFDTGLGALSIGGVDNIVVSVVPIPAAVWLFGSALLGLGWIRKR